MKFFIILLFIALVSITAEAESLRYTCVPIASEPRGTGRANEITIEKTEYIQGLPDFNLYSEHPAITEHDTSHLEFPMDHRPPQNVNLTIDGKLITGPFEVYFNVVGGNYNGQTRVYHSDFAVNQGLSLGQTKGCAVFIWRLIAAGNDPHKNVVDDLEIKKTISVYEECTRHN